MIAVDLWANGPLDEIVGHDFGVNNPRFFSLVLQIFPVLSF